MPIPRLSYILRLVQVILALACALLLSPPLPSSAQAPEVASYRISVTLDVDRKSLQGTESISFLNSTANPTSELYFHLYPNAFRGPDSTFMRENRSASRRASAENNWGGMDVTTLRLTTGEDLLPQATVDDTVMRVPLPRPLQPGQSLELEAQFSVQLVRVIARSGYEGDHFTIGQWFPKLAVLTDNGWNAHQYHANSEFFADFGSYHVEITLPERFVVGATGTLKDENSNANGTKTLTFEATSVHDFAWAANPSFKEARARAGSTEIRLLYQAAHEDREDRFMKAAVAAVESFSRWFGPYPYPQLTVVDVPPDAGSGMEYPTFVTVETTDPPLPGILLEEQVTIHEIAHQWWYGMVASNEFEEAWLDEGFASYSTRKLVDQLYGTKRSLGDVLGVQVGQLAYDRSTYLSVRHLDPVVLDSWKFHSFDSYAGTVYSKADLILGTLEGYLGSEKMGGVMRAYFQRFAFHHPTTRDFLGTVRDVAGAGLEPLLQEALYNTAVFDYAAEATTIAREGGGVRSTVTARRLGDGVAPVEVVSTFEDGSRQMEEWNGESESLKHEYVRPSPVVKVEVDPSHKLLLDARWANNGWTSWFNADSILRRAGDVLWLFQSWLKLAGMGL